MIDVHLHLLPSIDDGAPSLDVSRKMLEMMAGMGFRQLVSTPHLMQPLTPEYHQAALSALEQVRPLAAALRIDVSLGYEHLLDPQLPKRLTGHEPSTLAGTTHVLVELPFINWPMYTESTLFELRTAGFRPILAHPERYADALTNPDLVVALAEQGVPMQLSTGSFDGVYGKAVQKLARTILNECLKRDLPVIFATDAHSPGQRLSRVPAGLAWIRSNVLQGEMVATWASAGNPSRILLDQPLIGFRSWLADQAPAEAMAGWGAPGKSEPGERGRSRLLFRRRA